MYTPWAPSLGRFEQHLRFLLLLRSVVVERAAGGPLVELPPTGDRRGEPTLAGQDARGHTLLIGLPLVRIERCKERLGVRQRNLRRHGRKAEAGHQARFEREFRTQPQRLTRPPEVGRGGQLVVEAVQAAVGRDYAVAQYLAQSDQLVRGRTAPGYETSETPESLQPCVSRGPETERHQRCADPGRSYFGHRARQFTRLAAPSFW